MKKPYYITTAIAYTSAKPHIGNTYEIVLADAIARYKPAPMSMVRRSSRRRKLPASPLRNMLIMWLPKSRASGI